MTRKILLVGIFFIIGIILLSCNKKKEEPVVEPTAVELKSFQVIPPKVTDKEYLSLNRDVTNIGIYLNKPENILKLDVMPDIVGWFEDWNNKSSKNKIELFGTDHLAIPMITWQPTNIPLEDIAEGKHDDYIKGYFERLAIICPENDVLIRFAHEMEVRPDYEVTWYSWQDRENPDNYKQAWRHIVTLGHQYNSNIKWIWSPNRADEYAQDYYPGDEYVDFVGLTLNLPEERTSIHQTFSDFYVNEGTKENLELYNKPILISEVAYSGKNEEQKAAYLRSVFEYVKTDPKIVGIVFFNEDVSDHQLYRITDNELYMEVIYEEIRKIRDEKESS